jgi:hypothetical protein
VLPPRAVSLRAGAPVDRALRFINSYAFTRKSKETQHLAVELVAFPPKFQSFKWDLAYSGPSRWKNFPRLREPLLPQFSHI